MWLAAVLFNIISDMFKCCKLMPRIANPGKRERGADDVTLHNVQRLIGDCIMKVEGIYILTFISSKHPTLPSSEIFCRLSFGTGLEGTSLVSCCLVVKDVTVQYWFALFLAFVRSSFNPFNILARFECLFKLWPHWKMNAIYSVYEILNCYLNSYSMKEKNI